MLRDLVVEVVNTFVDVNNIDIELALVFVLDELAVDVFWMIVSPLRDEA